MRPLVISRGPRRKDTDTPGQDHCQLKAVSDLADPLQSREMEMTDTSQRVNMRRKIGLGTIDLYQVISLTSRSTLIETLNTQAIGGIVATAIDMTVTTAMTAWRISR